MNLAAENTCIQIESQWGAKNYASLPIVLERARCAEVWDTLGNRYLDFMGAYSAANLGHCHPRITSALINQALRLDVVSRAFYSDRLGLFLQKACKLLGQDLALPMNTGAEAVETALKVSRKWGYEVKGVEQNKAEIICCSNNFHGRTIGVISMSTSDQARQGYGPYLPGFKCIPFNDTAELERAITKNTVAFLVEPIQGEAGIIVPDADYLEKCARICRENNVLLVVDEIQTGLGRTGRLLESENAKADVTIIGKSLGGGVVPVSLVLSRKGILDVFKPGDHGSTFGGYPIAAAVASETLSIIEDEELCEKARQSGEYLIQKLQAIANETIKEVRGRGLMIGVEVNTQNGSAEALVQKLLRGGILCKNVNHAVIRLAPPLAISRTHIEEFLNVFESAVQ